jgi:capsule polysaccharide export protein KpsE/RkpR
VEELVKLTDTLAMSEAAQRRLFFERQVVAAKDSLADAEVELKKVQEATGILEPQNQARVLVEGLAQLQGLIAAKEVELTAMRTFAAPGNPDLARAQSELGGLRAQLAKMQREHKMQPGDIMVPTSKVPERALEWVRRMREVKYHETVFEMLARQYELAKVEESHSSTVIQTLDSAVKAERKTKPKRALIVIISTLLAFVSAVVWVFGKEKLTEARRDVRFAAKLDLLRNSTLNGRSLNLSRLSAWRRRRNGSGGDTDGAT